MRSVFRVGERCGAVTPTRKILSLTLKGFSTSPQGGGETTTRLSCAAPTL
jgi:hypothetical protein